MNYLEKFTFFGKNNKLNLIKKAENKIAKGCKAVFFMEDNFLPGPPAA